MKGTAYIVDNLGEGRGDLRIQRRV